MMKHSLIIGVAALAAVIVSRAHAQELVAVDAANPPFMYADGEKAAGIYPAILSETFKQMGVSAEIVPMPWKRAISGIDAGENGVGGIYQNSERLQKYDYSDKLLDEVIVVYVLKGKGFPFAGIDSLKGRTVGVIRGWSYGDDFDAAAKAGSIKTDEATGDGLNFAKLAAGRLDVVLAIKESGASVIASNGLADKVEALPTPLSSSPSYLAFAKSSHKGAELAQFNAALAAMHRDGSFDKIVSSALAH